MYVVTFTVLFRPCTRPNNFEVRPSCVGVSLLRASAMVGGIVNRRVTLCRVRGSTNLSVF